LGDFGSAGFLGFKYESLGFVPKHKSPPISKKAKKSEILRNKGILER
jgi:hypothetical protein